MWKQNPPKNIITKNINSNDKLKQDKSLRHKRTDFSFQVPSYEQQVKEMADWVNSHKDFYPHYFNK